MPINYKDYPPDWKAIRAEVLARAGNACEGSPAHPDCRAKNGQPHPETGSRVVLTVAHMDHDRTNNDRANLRALCQRCHLQHDTRQHAQARRRNRLIRAGQLELPEAGDDRETAGDGDSSAAVRG